MSRSGLRLAIYAHGRGLEPCRAPQRLTQPRFSLVLPGVAGDLSSELRAEFSLADERVVGRLRGGEAALGAAAGWVGSATGAADEVIPR